MDTTQHTPGPWQAVKLYGQPVHAIIRENGSRILADEIGNMDDAHLIAAAPEMLEALRKLFEHCAMIHKQWGDGDNSQQAEAARRAARAAIAKAEGAT